MRPTFTPTVIPTDTPVPTATPMPTDTPTPLPTDTPTPAAPKAIIGGDGQVNVRTGPGTAYAEAGQVATGTELDIVSSNAAGDWYEVCCVNGQNVWIVARLVEVTGDPALIQVAQNIPAPPTATTAPYAAAGGGAAAACAAHPAACAHGAACAHLSASRSGRSTRGPTAIPRLGLRRTVQRRADLTKPVTGYKLVVTGAVGRAEETEFGPAFLRGDVGIRFLFNAKIELPLSEGTFRA